MITMVTTESVNRNKFPGMTLAEACYAAENAINEACNEFQMNVLLNEHSYLYANGCELEYADESGALNEAGVNLKETVVGIVKKGGEILKSLWDKAAEAVANIKSSVVASFAKAGLNKKHIIAVANNWNNIEWDSLGGKAIHIKGGAAITDFGKSTIDKFVNDYKSLLLNDAGEIDIDGFIDRYYKDGDATIDMAAGFRGSNYVNMFNNANEFIYGTNAIDVINKARKAANDAMNARIKSIKASKQADNINEQIAGLKKAMSQNTKLTNAAVRLVNNETVVSAKILKVIMSNKGVKTFLFDQTRVGGAVSNVSNKMKNKFPKKDPNEGHEGYTSEREARAARNSSGSRGPTPMGMMDEREARQAYKRTHFTK